MNYPGSDPTSILLAFVVIAVLVVLIYFLARSFFKERAKLRAEKAFSIEGVLSKGEMTSIISNYISKAGKDAKFSLIHIDIDKFSDYIKAFGNEEAESIIERVCKNIENVLPKGVRIARLQNDEFLIFYQNDREYLYAVDLAGKVKQAINKPLRVLADTEINLTASIAVVYYPIHGSTVKDLLNSLQVTTYVVKKAGGNQVRVYQQEMDLQSGEHIEYYYQIKRAMQNDEFTLYYHPIIDTENNDIYGVEALLRWNHPEHGVLSPYKFLPILEQSGDIKWISIWGLEKITSTYLELKQKFPNRNVMFSLNLSPKQLMYSDLAQEYQKILRKNKVDAKNFILETAEYTIFEQNENIQRNVSMLRKLGFKVAIDGFGLNYQTLSQVGDFEIDIIKLDNEFLKDQQAYMKQKFADLLIDFAKHHKYNVICEAIENKEMLQAAKGYKIRYMQGYYYSKPLSKDDLTKYISNKSWDLMD